MNTNAIARTDYSTEELAVIEKQFFPAGASPEEQRYCFAVAKQLSLSPLTREIYFVPRRQKIGEKWITKVEPMVGRDGFLAIAHKTGQLAGMETSASIRDVPQLVGASWKERSDLVAECLVWRKDSDKPFTVQVAYSEYCQRNADGLPTRFWAEKPETMLKKVAESQALRKAFNIHGVYSPEEMGAGFEDSGGRLVVSTPAIEADFSATEGRAEEPTPKSRSKPKPEPKPDPVPEPEDDWPPMPTPRQTARNSSGDVTLADICSMLDAKGIKYELDEECGYVAAKSYAQKDFLKSLGFTWETETKSWVWTGLREAA